jgi:hypothetical protein
MTTLMIVLSTTYGEEPMIIPIKPSDLSQAPLTDAVVQIIGKDSNAFAILGYVHRCILSSNHPELADDFMREATAGDYNHLLITCMRYVTIK